MLGRGFGEKPLPGTALNGEQGGVNEPRRDDVDAARRQFRGDGADEALHRVAHCGQGQCARPGIAGRITAHQHDGGVIAQVLGAQANRIGVAPQLAERALKGVQVHPQERAGCPFAASGGVDQHVDRRVAGEGFREGLPIKHVNALQRRADRQFARHPLRVAAERHHLGAA